MTTRERFMAGGVLSVILIVGAGFLFNLLFLGPLADRRHAIEAAREEIRKKNDRIRQVEADKPKLARWKAESLPGDTDTERYSTTSRLYSHYLRNLLADSGLDAMSTMKIVPARADARNVPVLAGKKPIYTRLTFSVEDAHGKLSNVVDFLDRFYHTGLLQQVKSLSMQRPRTPRTAPGEQQQADELDVRMTIEALVVNGAEPRSFLPYVDRRLLALDAVAGLRHGPTGLGVGLDLGTVGVTGKAGPTALAQPARRYEDILAKNIFFPKEEAPESDVEITQFVYLTDITHNSHEAKGHENEAVLFDRLQNHTQHLRAGGRAFNTFTVRDEQGETLVRGTVLRLDDRDVYFQADGKYYALHVGQSVEEALRHPLSDSKVKELKLSGGSQRLGN